MEQKTDRLYPSAPLENIDLEQRLEKRMKDVNNFNNHINDIKETIFYFKAKNNETKKKYKKYKPITTILKSFDAFVNIATTSNSFTLSLTGIELIAIPIANATAGGSSIGNKVFHLSKNNKYKKQYERDEQTVKFLTN